MTMNHVQYLQTNEEAALILKMIQGLEADKHQDKWESTSHGMLNLRRAGPKWLALRLHSGGPAAQVYFITTDGHLHATDMGSSFSALRLIRGVVEQPPGWADAAQDIILSYACTRCFVQRRISPDELSITTRLGGGLTIDAAQAVGALLAAANAVVGELPSGHDAGFSPREIIVPPGLAGRAVVPTLEGEG